MSQKICSICFESYAANNLESKNLIKLPICEHIYHEECILHWLRNNITCPTCRADIRKNL